MDSISTVEVYLEQLTSTVFCWKKYSYFYYLDLKNGTWIHCRIQWQQES